MIKQSPSVRRELKLKDNLLKHASITLKKEFTGIDQVIDQILNGMSSWYLFPELQEKPTIINLWGLTGVGKTSVVSRIAELLRFDKRFYRFDMGTANEGEWEVKKQLETIYENQNGFPIIIALDEFQHARTLSEEGRESEKYATRIVWDLLDSGKFPISRNIYHGDDLFEVLIKLRSLMKQGVSVENGEVVSKHELFCQIMGEEPKRYTFYKYRGKTKVLKNKPSEPADTLLFVPRFCHSWIYQLAKEKFNSELEVAEKLKSMNAPQTLKFLADILEFIYSPKTIDCSKSLIFVLGNLDEAYAMNSNFNPDISADEFHEQSLKITVPRIKKALRKRFRSEQIARLGNFHIIYPAFNSESFRIIIKQELGKLSEWYLQSQGLKVTFADSVVDLIYKEGVYPTQGTRPVYSTINQHLKSKFGRIFSEVFFKKLKVDEVVFEFNEPVIAIAFKNKGKELHQISEVPELNLEKLRKPRKDDAHAITAVHESGHAIISTLLLNKLPEAVCSVTADDEMGGFVVSKIKWDFLSQKDVLPRTAMFLAGMAAERIIFGEERVTTGSEDDVGRATSFVAGILRTSGLGNIPGSYNVPDPSTNQNLYDPENLINSKVEEILQQALELACRILTEQKRLLVIMSAHLFENRMLKKEEVRKMVEEHAVDLERYNYHQAFSYKNRLMELIHMKMFQKHSLAMVSNNAKE